MNRKDLLGLRDLTRDEITEILDTAERFRNVSGRRSRRSPRFVVGPS